MSGGPRADRPPVVAGTLLDWARKTLGRHVRDYERLPRHHEAMVRWAAGP